MGRYNFLEAIMASYAYEPSSSVINELNTTKDMRFNRERMQWDGNDEQLDDFHDIKSLTESTHVSPVIIPNMNDEPSTEARPVRHRGIDFIDQSMADERGMLSETVGTMIWDEGKKSWYNIDGEEDVFSTTSLHSDGTPHSTRNLYDTDKKKTSSTSVSDGSKTLDSWESMGRVTFLRKLRISCDDESSDALNMEHTVMSPGISSGPLLVASEPRNMKESKQKISWEAPMVPDLLSSTLQDPDDVVEDDDNVSSSSVIIHKKAAAVSPSLPDEHNLNSERSKSVLSGASVGVQLSSALDAIERQEVQQETVDDLTPQRLSFNAELLSLNMPTKLQQYPLTNKSDVVTGRTRAISKATSEQEQIRRPWDNMEGLDTPWVENSMNDLSKRQIPVQDSSTGTVAIKSEQAHAHKSTPEWSRGDTMNDLFAPLQLQRLFVEPRKKNNLPTQPIEDVTTDKLISPTAVKRSEEPLTVENNITSPDLGATSATTMAVVADPALNGRPHSLSPSRRISLTTPSSLVPKGERSGSFGEKNLMKGDGNFMNSDDFIEPSRVINAASVASLAGADASVLCRLDLSNRRADAVHGLDAFTSLRRLFLQHNHLTSLNTLSLPSGLTFLSLQANRLFNDPFVNCVHMNIVGLSVLNLVSNFISDLTGLSSLNSLSELYLADNRLTSLESLGALPLLEVLDVQHNALTQLSGLDRLPRLSTLCAGHNDIQALEGLDALGHLTLLDLDGNLISVVLLTEPLPRLATLRLTNNLLKVMVGFSKLFPALRKLDVSNNLLSSLSGLVTETDHMSRLRIIRATNNQIDDSAPWLPSGLRELDLRNNSIRSLAPFYTCASLRILRLEGNLIRDIAPDQREFYAGLRGLPNLQLLDLSKNLLTGAACVTGLLRLRTLLLCDNSIGNLADLIRDLMTLRGLRCIDVRRNPSTANFYPDDMTIAAAAGTGANSAMQHESMFSSIKAFDECFSGMIAERAFATRLCFRARLVRHFFNSLNVLDGISISPDERKIALVDDLDVIFRAAPNLGLVSSDSLLETDPDEYNEISTDARAKPSPPVHPPPLKRPRYITDCSIADQCATSDNDKGVDDSWLSSTAGRLNSGNEKCDVESYGNNDLSCNDVERNHMLTGITDDSIGELGEIRNRWCTKDYNTTISDCSDHDDKHHKWARLNTSNGFQRSESPPRRQRHNVTSPSNKGDGGGVAFWVETKSSEQEPAFVAPPQHQHGVSQALSFWVPMNGTSDLKNGNLGAQLCPPPRNNRLPYVTPASLRPPKLRPKQNNLHRKSQKSHIVETAKRFHKQVESGKGNFVSVPPESNNIRAPLRQYQLKNKKNVVQSHPRNLKSHRSGTKDSLVNCTDSASFVKQRQHNEPSLMESQRRRLLTRLVSMAAVPPAPVDRKDVFRTLVRDLSVESPEFTAIADLFAVERGVVQDGVVRVLKVYCKASHAALHAINDSAVSNDSDHEGLRILYHADYPRALSDIVNEGFKPTDTIGGSPLVFCTSVTLSDQLFRESGQSNQGIRWRVLLTLVKLGNVLTFNRSFDEFSRKRKQYMIDAAHRGFDTIHFSGRHDVFVSVTRQRCVPAYLVEYDVVSV